MDFKIPIQSRDRFSNTHTAFICIYKLEGTIYKEVATDSKIVLMMKQTGLSVMTTFNMLTELAYNQPEQEILMTTIVRSHIFEG